MQPSVFRRRFVLRLLVAVLARCFSVPAAGMCCGYAPRPVLPHSSKTPAIARASHITSAASISSLWKMLSAAVAHVPRQVYAAFFLGLALREPRALKASVTLLVTILCIPFYLASKLLWPLCLSPFRLLKRFYLQLRHVDAYLLGMLSVQLTVLYGACRHFAVISESVSQLASVMKSVFYHGSQRMPQVATVAAAALVYCVHGLMLHHKTEHVKQKVFQEQHDAQASVDVLKTALKSAELKNAATEKQLSEKQREHTNLVNDMERLKKVQTLKATSLKSEISSKNQDCGALKKEIAEHVARIKAVESQLHKATSEIQQLEIEKQQDYKCLSKDMDNLRKSHNLKVRFLNDEIFSKHQDCESFKKEIENNVAHVRVVQSQFQRATREVQQLEIEKQREHTLFMKDIERLKESHNLNVVSLKSEILSKNQDCEALNKEIANNVAHIKAVESQLHMATSEIQQLKTSMTKMQDDHAEALKSLEAQVNIARDDLLKCSNDLRLERAKVMELKCHLRDSSLDSENLRAIIRFHETFHWPWQLAPGRRRNRADEYRKAYA